ncbi:cutinase family protein [Nocardia brasiliensis]
MTLTFKSGGTLILAAVAAACLGVVPAGTAGAGATECPAVFALGVQGTGQSSPGQSVTDDTGFLSAVFTPLQASADAAGVKVNREYIPYEASFGGFVSGSTNTSYAQSVSGGVDRLKARISEISGQCKHTDFALVGYSQGAQVVSQVAQAIGAGSGVVSPERVVAVALFGDPTRAANASTFVGTGGARRPATVPGTSGDALGGLDEINSSAPTGSGIGVSTEKSVSYGKLIGRVATFCTSGDLSCDAPADAPLLHAVANVAATVTNPGDPIQALQNIATSLVTTTIKTATNVVNNDISGTSLSQLALNPKKSISERIEEASDPTGPPVDAASTVKALMKVAQIGFNAVVTVAKSVLTTSNIAEIATAGIVDPVAGLVTLGTKLLSALTTLIPPATAIGWVQQAFTAFTNEITDNAGLFNATTWIKYSDAIQRHGSYLNDPASTSGASATSWVASWIAAAARDVAAADPPASSTARPSTTSSAGTGTATTTAPPTTTRGAPSSVAPTTPPRPTTTIPPQ